MEDLGASVESVKNDVNQLKDQMGQILEALVALKNTRIILQPEMMKLLLPILRCCRLEHFKPIMLKKIVDDGLHMVCLLIILHLMKMCKVL